MGKLGDLFKGVSSLVTGPDLSPIGDATQAVTQGIDQAIATLRDQLQLDQEIRDEDIARFALEQGIFNDQQLDELEFRRDLQDERFQIEDIERGKFQAKEQERFQQFQGQQQRTIGGFEQFADLGGQAFEQFQRGGTVAGLGADISDIVGSEAFGGLLDIRRREQEGALSAGGLTRSGTALEAAGRLPTDLAFGIQQQLQGTRGAAAGQGLQALGGAAQANRFIAPQQSRVSQAADPGRSGIGTGFLQQLAGGGVASQIAGLKSGRGQAEASGILAQLQGQGQQLSNIGSFLGSAGGAAAAGGLFGSGGLGAAAASFFSDPRLKMNVEKITTFGDLNIYQWDWIPDELNGALNIGFMADEVESLYPHHVGELDGVQVINYAPLLDELERKFGDSP